jgi:hypothetical protein
VRSGRVIPRVERREQLRTTLPIRRVVGPDDVGSLSVHLMANTALTGATCDIDGGGQLVNARLRGRLGRHPLSSPLAGGVAGVSTWAASCSVSSWMILVSSVFSTSSVLMPP